MIGECPHCGGHTTQRASSVYEAGTAHTSSTFFVTGGGSGSAYGTQQTKLAKRAAPPKKAVGVVGLAARVFLYTFVCCVLLCGVPMCCILAQSKRTTEPDDLAEQLRAIERHVATMRADQAPERPAYLRRLERLKPGPGHELLWFVYFPAAAALLSLPFGIWNTLWNWTVHPRLMADWDRKWYCHCCGMFFHITPESSHALRRGRLSPQREEGAP